MIIRVLTSSPTRGDTISHLERADVMPASMGGRRGIHAVDSR